MAYHILTLTNGAPPWHDDDEALVVLLRVEPHLVDSQHRSGQRVVAYKQRSQLALKDSSPTNNAHN